MRRIAVSAGLCFFLMYSVSFATDILSAQSLQSPNFRFDESTLGAGGQIQSSSANYQSTSSTGDLGVGESASLNYQVQGGSKTTDDPALSFIVNNSDASFGSFSASTATVATATFSVINYTSYGYIVQIVGNAPSNGSYALPALSATSPSQAGTEQFGINMVANTAPTSVGANPDVGQFGFGSAAPNYNTPNQFRYVSGETIARGLKSSGKTTFTMSYLVNVRSVTPGGQYTTNQMVIVTGTY